MIDNTTNLPPAQIETDSSTEVRTFFDRYFTQEVSFPSNQIDSVLGFFLKRGFDEQSARSTAIVLLNQARIENVSPFKLIDTLKGLTDVQLSQVVAEVLNIYREKTSAVGYRLTTTISLTPRKLPFETGDIDDNNHLIVFEKPHQLDNKTKVFYSNNNNSSVQGLKNQSVYYVAVVNEKKIKLYTDRPLLNLVPLTTYLGMYPVYNSNDTYVAGNIVAYEKKLYVARTTTTGNVPTNIEFFDLYTETHQLEQEPETKEVPVMEETFETRNIRQ